MKNLYTAGAAAPPPRPWPAERPVSHRHTGRMAVQSGPFRRLFRPVCQCVVNQGIAQPRLWVVLFLQKWVLRQGACAARGVESGPPGGRRRWRVTWRNGPRGHGLPGVSAASAPPLLATLKPHAVATRPNSHGRGPCCRSIALISCKRLHLTKKNSIFAFH